MVDTLDLGSSASRRESSSLSFRTKFKKADLRSAFLLSKALIHIRLRFWLLAMNLVSLLKPTSTHDVKHSFAGVVELVDTLDLGSSASRRESSSLSFRTMLKKPIYLDRLFYCMK